VPQLLSAIPTKEIWHFPPVIKQYSSPNRLPSLLSQTLQLFESSRKKHPAIDIGKLFMDK
jgi:hypothetical protein